MFNFTTLFKRCSKKLNCIHPEQKNGGFLLATSVYFGKNKAKMDGFNPLCRKCASKASVDRAKRNPKKRRENQNRYVEKHREEINAKAREVNKTPERIEYKRKQREKNKKHIAEVKKVWYEKNKKHVYEKSAEWQRNNVEKVRMRNKKWAIRNPDKRLAGKHKRRAISIGNGGKYIASDIELIFLKQDGNCYYCDKELDNFHIDHVIPLCQSGSNSSKNLVLACPFCNLSKGGRTPQQWVEKIKDRKIQSIVRQRIHDDSLP